jgi:hypothetical protein
VDYATLNQTIIDYTENNEQSFVEHVPVFIRLAEQRVYHEVKLPQFRQHRAWRLRAGTPVQDLPVDFLAANSLLLEDGVGSLYYLDLKEPEYAMLAFGPNNVGTPRVYALRRDKELIVAPIPDSSYAVVLDYFYYPESITTVTSGHTWLGDNFETVLLYGSLMEAYTFMKGEADIMTGYLNQYSAALKLLKSFVIGPLHNDTYKAVAV